MKAKSKRRVVFRVALDIPDGVSLGELRAYIREAVGVWAKSASPDDPIFDLDYDSVRVVRVADGRGKS